MLMVLNRTDVRVPHAHTYTELGIGSGFSPGTWSDLVSFRLLFLWIISRFGFDGVNLLGRGGGPMLLGAGTDAPSNDGAMVFGGGIIARSRASGSALRSPNFTESNPCDIQQKMMELQQDEIN